ncbi:hypothetical protein PM10SUCC1_33400 [Propionigenium maris DSM 9537]|uniref:Uncharacterized protein n=1 Tax=Propionigenium maris DSM 9537 TaxID=1123000 RepID=A0A9W6LNX4_9FUSO|nr:hypothetical protein [Propionigenium maris]GLI57826.1 hypothetical protein PM10SUCC1_33400 [Propionigenium maris DSM 9537]
MLEEYEEESVEEYYTAVEENRVLKWLKYIVYALSIMILLNMFLYTCSLMKTPRREERYLQQSVVEGEREYDGGAAPTISSQ